MTQTFVVSFRLSIYFILIRTTRLIFAYLHFPQRFYTRLLIIQSSSSCTYHEQGNWKHALRGLNQSTESTERLVLMTYNLFIYMLEWDWQPSLHVLRFWAGMERGRVRPIRPMIKSRRFCPPIFLFFFWTIFILTYNSTSKKSSILIDPGDFSFALSKPAKRWSAGDLHEDAAFMIIDWPTLLHNQLLKDY